jgi:hypothetical protein
MRLRLDRISSNENNTFGLWFVDSDFFAFSIEDPFHEAKVAGQTRIPAGVYRVDSTYSPRFKKNMWELLNVPGYTGVRIHSLNTADDTEGCIGPGFNADINLDSVSSIHRSAEAMKVLDLKLTAAKDAGDEIRIKITDDIIERADLDW